MVSIPLYKKRSTATRNNHNDGDGADARSRRSRALLRSTKTSMPMYGALSDDYAAQIVVDGTTVVNVNIDTGSVAFAVAGSSDIGCDRYVPAADYISDGRCDVSNNVTATYGSGWWSGVMCNMTVRFGDVDDDDSSSSLFQVSDYSGGLMLRQRQMTTCARTPDDDPTSLSFREKPDVYMEGIAGFAFPDPTNPTFRPILSQLFFGDDNHHEMKKNSQDELQPVFGLQQCGYEPVLNAGGNGALDLGGFDPSHYVGTIQWTPVVEPRYWGVHMTAVRLGHLPSSFSSTTRTMMTTTTQLPNLMPENQTTALDESGRARTALDSGTSMAYFDPVTFESILQTLRSTLSDAKDLPDSFYDGQACATLDEIDITQWPPLVLEFARDVENGNDDDEGSDTPVVLTIPACRYVELVPPGWCVGNAPDTRADFPHDQPAYSIAIGKAPPNEYALLGQVIFEQYYVAHDMTPGKERMGFAPLAGCSPASYCVDGSASPGVPERIAPHHVGVLLGVGISILTAVRYFRKKWNQRPEYTEILDT